MRTVLANGLRFACVEEGAGPLVLLLHGFPDTPQTWDRARPALASAGFRAVSPFLRGYHPTEIPQGGVYDMDTLGRDALALIDALGERAAIVVGHDWGAAAAYAAVGLDPTRVTKLVTVGLPHPAAVLPTPTMLWAARHFAAFKLPGAARRIRDRNLATIDELVARWSPAWKVPPGETEAAKRSLGEPGSLEAAIGYYRALGVRPSPGQRRPVEVPAAAFAGLDDTFPTDVYHRARSRFRAGYEVVEMRGGHFMHREHPEDFVRELVRVVS
jgi:pimeloyl-ACP methyl ester carboxylesterase